MIQYLDTSVLVTALTRERRTAEMQAWLSEQKTRSLAISDWVVTEFSAALSIKLRSSQIEGAHRAAALAAFSGMIGESLDVLPFGPEYFRAAAIYADQYALGLRAGDALHLAIAANHGAMLCTLDKRLADAAPAVGVNVRLL